MREIKFRAWLHDGHWGIERYGQMIYEYETKIIFESCGFRDEDMDMDIMQYTGLKDKNGKDIYEGDIIRYGLREGLGQPEETGLKRQVKYSPYGFFGQWDFDIIVIGNIHQNPELL